MKNYAKTAAHKLRHIHYIEKFKRLKTYSLFIAMMIGIIFYRFFVDVRWITNLFMPDDGEPIDITFITKYTLFAMLFITYCKVSPKQMRFTKLHTSLGLIQLLGCWICFGLLYPVNPMVAAGVFICILAPTATSAPVITGMLGGSVPSLATYSIASNLSIALFAPLFLTIIGTGGDLETNFVACFFAICQKVVPLVIGPFILAIIVKALIPSLHHYFQSKQIISFWLWAFSLVMLMARTMGNLMKIDSKYYFCASIVAFGALIICCILFYTGRHVGRNFGDAVAGGQALGQKNTILAIWLAQTFLDPEPKYLIASIAPASYVLWQNIINSYQLWRKKRQEEKEIEREQIA